jgi:hypothetical protein
MIIFKLIKKQFNSILFYYSDKLLIKKITNKKITYLSKKKLLNLANECHDKEDKSVPGVFIEAGCALGGSSILIASLKKNKRQFIIYDVFDIIPPPSTADTADVHARYSVISKGESLGIRGDKYYGYIENIQQRVIDNFHTFQISLDNHYIRLVKGMVQNTLDIDEPVALAHIDVDWYEPVMTCLQKIFPLLSVGGTIILDDYKSWGGCRKAADEYLDTRRGEFKTTEVNGAFNITRVCLPSKQ